MYPCGQAIQLTGLVWLKVPEYLPAGQEIGSPLPEGQYAPAGHALLHVVSFVVLESSYLPAGHRKGHPKNSLSEFATLASVVYVPLGHAVKFIGPLEYSISALPGSLELQAPSPGIVEEM